MTGITIGEPAHQIHFEINEVFGFPESTCYKGGYDAFFDIEILVPGIRATGRVDISTGELYQLSQALQKHNKSLKGDFTFESAEHQLTLQFKYTPQGRVEVLGEFQQYGGVENSVSFELPLDQSHIAQTINQLLQLEEKYGGMKGVRGELK